MLARSPGPQTRVTLIWGDEVYTVPLYLAVKIHFEHPPGETTLRPALSNAQLIDAIDDFCGTPTPGELPLALLRRWRFWGRRLPELVHLGPIPREDPAADPTQPVPWLVGRGLAFLNPHPLPPSALEMVPFAFRERVLDLLELSALEGSAVARIAPEDLAARAGAVSAAIFGEFDELCPPPRKPPIRRRFPPLEVLAALVSTLPSGTVQVIAAELLQRASGRLLA